MSVLPGDPLLGAARFLLTVLMVTTLAAAIASIGAAVALVLHPSGMLDWLAQASGRSIPPAAAGKLSGALALLAGVSALSLLGQGMLRQLIDSVAHGDPFVPENARRLVGMAWVTVAVQLLSIGIASLIGWARYAMGALHGQFGFSLGGVLLALVLFILARVFRRGAAMREELEGTV